MKKVRFGAGKYNGFGGKVGDKPEFAGETIEEALIREGKEEFGITIEDFENRGSVDFVFPKNPDWGQLVHIFVCKKWKGEPTESEEMKPGWFKLNEIPYEKMWDDDKYWLPRILAGETINANFDFNVEGKVTKYEIKTISKAPETK